MFIIDDNTKLDLVIPADKARGYVERDFKVHPPQMFSPPSDMDMIDPSNWDALIDEEEAQQSSLEHHRMTGDNGKPIPSLDQGQVGYCWAHSVTHTAMLARKLAGQPYVPLSAYSVAAIIKKGADEGGWCGLAAEFGRDNGFNSQMMWAQGRRDYKTLNTPEAILERAKYRISADYVDIARPVYSQNLTWKQLISCLLRKQPCAVDFNWWGHSVCALRVVRVEAGSYGIKIWNSWGDGWGEHGMAVLRGNKALPDGAVCTRLVMAA